MEDTGPSPTDEMLAAREEAIEGYGFALRSDDQQRIGRAQADIEAAEKALAEARQEAGITRSPEAEAKIAQALAELAEVIETD